MTTRCRKTPKVKRRKGATATRRRHPTAADLQKQLGQRTRERDEALKQLTATGEILRIIIAPQTDLRRVLDAVVKSAARFCDADDVTIFELEGQDVQLESFPLPPLIAGVVKTIEPLTAENGNQVTVHCNEAIGALHADQMRLRQALLNLMSNANKFTERGTITVDARQGQEGGRDCITIAVADTGIGMTAEQMSRLFQEFSQADASTTRK